MQKPQDNIIWIFRTSEVVVLLLSRYQSIYYFSEHHIPRRIPILYIHCSDFRISLSQHHTFLKFYLFYKPADDVSRFEVPVGLAKVPTNLPSYLQL